MTVRTSFLRTLGFVFALVAGASSSWASPNTAAKAFIATLSDEERRLALTSFDDSDRTEWRLTPGSRGGLSMGRMDRATLNATMGLLATVLSKKGLELVSEIRKREAALDELEGGSGYRDPNKYYLALFGTPGAQQWGLRFEGHHLTFNISLSGDKIVSVLPYSFGSNPDRMPDSGKRLVTDILKRAAATVKTGSNGISRLLENLLD
ncbi:MAG TPA: hypothetical protein DCE33_10135, partial [Rhodospirillaceae bacterium]|nr:hypothetical protein [Rhodospirillaceae bacterium]